MDTYNNQMVSVDMVIFTINDFKLKVLFIKRNKDPFKDMWSLPGGLVYSDEKTEEAVLRELKEKLNITDINPELAGVFSDPKRDIRFRNISVAYYGIVNYHDFKFNVSSDKVNDTKWFEVSDLPTLAFDHIEIFNKAYELFKKRVYDIDYISKYIDSPFTLNNLQGLYEHILNMKIDKRNFRRKMNSLSCLVNTGKKNNYDPHKKSDLYKFKK